MLALTRHSTLANSKRIHLCWPGGGLVHAQRQSPRRDTIRIASERLAWPPSLLAGGASFRPSCHRQPPRLQQRVSQSRSPSPPTETPPRNSLAQLLWPFLPARVQQYLLDKHGMHAGSPGADGTAVLGMLLVGASTLLVWWLTRQRDAVFERSLEQLHQSVGMHSAARTLHHIHFSSSTAQPTAPLLDWSLAQQQFADRALMEATEPVDATRDSTRDIAWAAISGPEGSGKSSLLTLALTAFEKRAKRDERALTTIARFNAASLQQLEQDWRRFADRELHIPHALYLDAAELRAQVALALRLRPNWLLAFDDVEWSAGGAVPQPIPAGACRDFTEFEQQFLPSAADVPSLLQNSSLLQGCILTSSVRAPPASVPSHWHADLGLRPMPIALLTAIAFEQTRAPHSQINCSVAEQHALAEALPNPLALQLLQQAGFRDAKQAQAALSQWRAAAPAADAYAPHALVQLCARVRSSLHKDARTLLDTLVSLDTQQLQVQLVRDLAQGQLDWTAPQLNTALDELLQRQLLTLRSDQGAYAMRPTLQRHFSQLVASSLPEVLPSVFRVLKARIDTSEAQRQDLALLSHVSHVLRASGVLRFPSNLDLNLSPRAGVCVVPLSPDLLVAFVHIMDAMANADATRTNTHYVAESALLAAKAMVEQAAAIEPQHTHVNAANAQHKNEADATVDKRIVEALTALNPNLALWYCRLFYSIGRLNFYRCDLSLQSAANDDLRRAISLSTAIGDVQGHPRRPVERLLAKRMGLCFVESLPLQKDGLPSQAAVAEQMRTLRALVSTDEQKPYVNITVPEDSPARSITPHTDPRFRAETGRQLLLHHVHLRQRLQARHLFSPPPAWGDAWTDLATYAPDFVSGAGRQPGPKSDCRDTVALARLLLLSESVPAPVLEALQAHGLPAPPDHAQPRTMADHAAKWLLDRVLQQPSNAGAAPPVMLVQSISNAHLALAELHHRRGKQERALAHLQCCSYLQQSMPSTHPDVVRRSALQDEWAWQELNAQRQACLQPW